MSTPFESDPITITKLEAARRQLGTAIELWFDDRDHISILSLAYASHEIIHRLYRNQGHSDLLYDSTIIKDEYRGEFAKFLKQVPNFIKHANNEAADATVTLQPGMNPMFLMMSVYAISKMDIALTRSEHAFFVWYGFHYPNAKFLQAFANKGIPVEAIESLKSRGRKDFYENLIKIWTKP